MGSLRKFLITAILKPWRHSGLYDGSRTRGLGFRTGLLLVVLGLAFSLTSIAQAACGHFPSVPVILPLRLENYFVWQALLVVPWIVLSWFLVGLLARVLLGLMGAAVSLRQVLVLLGLGFSSFLFLLWIPHLLTAIFYLLGMSQKEWVDLLSQPGWFQTLYLVLIALAILAGWLSLNLSLGRISKKRRPAGYLVANLGFLTWLLLLVVFLR
ncbi:MAG: hypothetical protein HPY46_08860 [Candidatus Aminicenantes bacterium]|nr:hypothetical protein [Candidatus Aminicenantes bacterium]